VSGLDFLAVLSAMMLFIVWLGYPAVVWALARLRREGVVWPEAPLPMVSVVVVTREAPAAVLARVENCLAADYPEARLEVVIALDREIEDLDYALPALAPGRVRLVTDHHEGGKAAALNAGVRYSRGEVIVFADTFQRFTTDTIYNLVDALRDPRLGAVSGSLQIPNSGALIACLYWRYERWLRSCEALLHSTVGVSGSVYAMRKHLWKPLPAGLLLDDLYGPMQMALDGMRVGFAENAIAIEQRSAAPAGEYRRKVRTLTGVLQVCAWLPAVLSPGRNPIWLQFVIHKLLRMATPLALLFMGAWAIGFSLLLPLEHLLYAGLGSATAALWIVRGRSAHAARLRTIVVEGSLLQAAIIVAGVNGLRGRWEIW
jgi:cellulose synthase/poly-beta-1,6-N-acetylglucosamine synthase-like glycosyltransferase